MHTHVINSPKYGRAFVHLDDCDADLLEGVTWGAHFVRGGVPHCISRQVGRSAILLHHEVMKRVHPSIKFDRYVVCDHISGNPFDCTRQNLRVCSNKQNAQNRQQKRNSSVRHPGVYLIKETGRWRALIIPNGERIHLGVYDTVEEAIAVRKDAEIKHFGEFAFSNRLLTSTN
jgi:hypothetical protein